MSKREAPAQWVMKRSPKSGVRGAPASSEAHRWWGPKACHSSAPHRQDQQRPSLIATSRSLFKTSPNLGVTAHLILLPKKNTKASKDKHQMGWGVSQGGGSVQIFFCGLSGVVHTFYINPTSIIRQITLPASLQPALRTQITNPFATHLSYPS